MIVAQSWAFVLVDLMGALKKSLEKPPSQGRVFTAHCGRILCCRYLRGAVTLVAHVRNSSTRSV